MKIFRLPFFTSLFLLAHIVFSQTTDTVKVYGQVVTDSGVAVVNSLRVVSYKQNESYAATLNADGVFSISIPLKEPELFEFKYHGYSKAFLLAPSESLCRFMIHVDSQGVKTMRPAGSKENEAYKLFKRAYQPFKEMLKYWKDSCDIVSADCKAKLKKETTVMNAGMDIVLKGAKGTYSADVLSRLAKLPDILLSISPVSDLQQHFFDSVNFADKRIFNTPDLSEKVSAYLDNFADTSTDGRMKFILRLMNQTKGNKEVQKELAALLFQNFIGENRESYLQNLVQWASTQPSFSEEQPVMASKINVLQKVLPGSTAPRVSGEDTSGRTQNLIATAKNNKLTLLIFWESDCPHCRKAMPSFIRIYEKYHLKGLEVFAASLDSDRGKWKQFVTANHLAWLNVLLPENRTAHSDYFIQYTPTVVLIDRNGIIVRRFIDVEDLDKVIETTLK